MSFAYFTAPEINTHFAGKHLIVFDMDGLLIDSEPLQLRAFQEIADRLTLTIDTDNWNTDYVGNSEYANMRQLLDRNTMRYTDDDIEQLVAEKNQRYHRLVEEQDATFARDGVLALITYITEQTNMQLAVATSSQRAEVQRILGKKLDILHHFTYVIAGDDVSRSKPHPDTYQRVAEDTGIAPAQTLVFEDTQPGVASATTAGSKCIAVPNDFTKEQDFSHATLIISDLTPQATVL